MKVVKPNKLSVLTRCFEHERQFLFGVSVLVFVPLAEELELLSEQALWTFVPERMGPQGIIEEGIPKARAEFLVHGSCFAPGGVPHPRVPVSVKVGECERALSVTGDRYFTPGGSPSEPQPFTQMPLDWGRAYGGPKYDRNPLGRGHGKSEYMGQQVQMLPNIEDPEALVHAPRDRVEPAGFGPLDIGWPQRRKLAGTYDQRWLEEHFPGLAPDVDWQMFNRAQPAQRIDGFWQGGEPYRLHNLHPQRPVIEGQLPRLTARAFIGRRQGEGPEAAVGIMPVEQSLRTVWLFPDAERAVLIFQGSIVVERDDASDVEFLVIGAEHQDAPRPHEHYAAALSARLDPDHGPMATLAEHELLPEGTAGTVDGLQAAERDIFSSDRKLEHNLHRRAQREYERAVLDLQAKQAELRAQGLDQEASTLDPEVLGLRPPEPPAPIPSTDELPQVLEQLQAEAEAKQKEAEAGLEQRREQLAQKLQAMDLSEDERAKLLRPDEQEGPTGPPTFTAEGQRHKVRALLQQVRETGAPTEDLEALLEDPEEYERWVQAETQLRDNYRETAHMQDPAPRMAPARSEEAHGLLRAALEAGEDLSHYDLTGADLSGMDLRNANLAGALLESACLDGADLRGADLRKAVLAHGSLRKARLDDANLAGANLGKCRLQEAAFTGADLTGVQLTEADLTRASLHGAKLHEVTLTKATLSHADAREVQTDALVFTEVEAAGIQLHGAQLPKAVFLRLDLREGDLSGANLAGATFLGCDLREVSLAGAALDGARFVEACQLDGARLLKATLGMTNLRGSSLRGSDFSEAMLDGADLSECTLVEAKLYRAVARGTRFEKADLSEASLVSANLMEASFLNATIVGADLRGSNLFAADMARVRTDERVKLEGANLTRVRIHPRHEEAPA